MNAILLKKDKTRNVASITSIFANMDSDNSLVKNFIKGDENAFEMLFHKYYLRLCHYAFQFVENMPDAEELVQETFVNIWERKESLEIESSFRSYLYQAVKNRGLNTIRSNQRRIKHYQLNQQASPIDSVETDDKIHLNELSKKLFEGLETLPPKCKKIFQMSRLEGLKHKEIAGIMKIKTKTVENQIGIALKSLRKYLADYLQIIILFISTSN